MNSQSARNCVPGTSPSSSRSTCAARLRSPTRALRQLTVHARRVGGATAPGEAWDPILAAARASFPGSGSISVTDAAGIIRRSTQRAIIGQSRRDNYLFKQLDAVDRDELVVDRPLMSIPQPRRLLIPIGRRLVNEDGTFDGTVVAVVMPEAFREFFRTVDVGEEGIVIGLSSRRRRAVSRAVQLRSRWARPR